MDRPRTKLVCTIGPASFERVGELVAAGMDVARINFSHGTADDHKAYVHAVRAAAHSARRSVAVMVDLPGPKIRLGELEGGAITLIAGATFTLSPESQADAVAADVVPVPDGATDITAPSEAATDVTAPAEASEERNGPSDAVTEVTAPADAATETTDSPDAAGEMTVTPEAAGDSAETTEGSTATTATPYADDTTADLVETNAASRASDEGDDTTGSAMAVSEPTAAPEALGDPSGARVSTQGLAAQLEVGDRVLLADGAAELRVTAISGSAVETEVVHGGMVRSRSGVSIPSSRLTGDGLTAADRAAVPRALELRADLIAPSFVRSADDVRSLRAMLPADGPRIVAKIETRAAVDNFDEIAQVADGIMVARGDLGVDIPFEEVPLIQKQLIDRSSKADRFTIVATQMLESMTAATRPTRAEASDVANAVLDGADAVMLSAETAIGSYPVEALQALAAICRATEKDPDASFVSDDGDKAKPPKAMVLAAAVMSGLAEVSAIWCFTRTGHTAEMLAMTRPGVPIVAFTLSPIVARRLAVRRGVIPMILPTGGKAEPLIDRMEGAWRSQKDRATYDTVILLTTSQQPAGINRLEIHRLAGRATSPR